MSRWLDGNIKGVHSKRGKLEGHVEGVDPMDFFQRPQ
jgi:hypothetical protein